MIFPRPPGPTNPPPSESGFFFCFSTLTWSALTIPDPVAPKPDPLVHPYFDNSRSANPFCPGRSDRGASSDASPSTVSSLAKVASSSASVAGMSSGGGGSVYRTGGRDIVAAEKECGGGGGGGGVGDGSGGVDSGGGGGMGCAKVASG